jgi:nondiscriminating glutamyl-tRNA synthetase
MITSFSIDRIGKAPAVFDRQKLAWMNGQHIRRLDPEQLYELAAPRLPGFVTDNYPESSCREIVAVLQASIDTLDDFDTLASVFNPQVAYDDEAKDVLAGEASAAVLGALRTSLAGLEDELTPETFKAAVKAVGKEVGRKGKEVFFPIRAAVTGSVHGPDLSRVCAIKGRDAVVALIDRAIS